MRIRALDLYCGGGGSSWGAQAAGAKIVCGVDAWELATDTFEWNFPNAWVICKRLTENSDRRIIRAIGRIDLVLASPECTNHTCARGSRRRYEQSRLTALYVLRFARAFRPRWVVIENVIQMRSWSRFDELISTLRDELHYHVMVCVLDAADFGVPQSRRRLFVVCDREISPEEIKATNGRRLKTVSDILDPAGIWARSPLYSKARAEPTLERAERAIAALGRREPFLIVYYGSDGSGGWQSLDRPLRTITTLDRFGLVEWEGRTPMLRMLQVPELMRAMGFGRDYALPFGSRRERIKLLGNGVCPPVMKAIVKSLQGNGSGDVASRRRLYAAE